MLICAACFIVGDSWYQQDKTPDQTPVEDAAPARQSVPGERSVSSPARRQPSLIARPVDSLPLIDDDDDAASRRSSLRGRSTDLDVGGSPATVDAIRRMRRKRSRGDRTRRREQSLARLSKAGGLLSPVEKTEFDDASGNRVTRYRTSPPTQFPQLPHIGQTRAAGDHDDDDVGSLFQFRSSRLDPSPSSWKSFVDDEEEFQKIVSSRTSTPGKLRSMLVESGIGDTKTEIEQPVRLREEEAAEDIIGTPTAKRLSYARQSSDDDAAAEIADMEPLPMLPAATSPSFVPRSSLDVRRSSLDVPRSSLEVPRASLEVPRSSVELPRTSLEVPRSSLEARPTRASSLLEPAVRRASMDAVVPPAPDSRFVTALSMPPSKRAVELQRIKESFSSSSVAAADLPSQPSSTTSKAALLHQRRAGGAATPDVPAQPSTSKQVRRSSILDVSDVPKQPSVTKTPGKPLAPTLDDITKQRMRILSRPPDDGYMPMLQTPLTDSGWETVYEEDLAQGRKPYPFYRTPVMASSLRTPSPIPQTKARRSWARAPAGGWSQHSSRRYSVPRLSPPKFIQRPVRDVLLCRLSQISD